MTEEEIKKACRAYCMASGCDDAKECHAIYCSEIDEFKKLLNGNNK
jgi:hypothetical protein